MNVLAFCENPNCGAIFESKIFGGPGSATIEMINSRVSPCPSCGGFGLIPDGKYSYANEAISFLTGPQTSVQKLQAVEAILRSASQKSSSRENIIEQIKAEDPKLAEWFKNFLPAINNAAPWIVILISLVSLAIQIHTSYFQKEVGIKDTFIQMLLENEKHRLKMQRQPFRREQPKIPRNAPCPCGSGKKYKKCCSQTIAT